jgi:hypothetical protein
MEKLIGKPEMDSKIQRLKQRRKSDGSGERNRSHESDLTAGSCSVTLVVSCLKQQLTVGWSSVLMAGTGSPRRHQPPSKHADESVVVVRRAKWLKNSRESHHLMPNSHRGKLGGHADLKKSDRFHANVLSRKRLDRPLGTRKGTC